MLSETRQSANGHGIDRPDPVLTENGRKVLEARYLKKNEAGQCIETPRELFTRVARTIANVELSYGADEAERRAWEDRFYDVMADGRFMPNSPTLMNAGREMGMLSACFVLPVRDSIVDIFDSIKHTALIQKAGGGTGFAFDELRPTGDYIASSGGTTSGPITFWRAFSEATNAIQQGAFRRGANMGMMYIHHPDILKFLHAKQDLSQFTNYNISVKVTDDWMEAFLADPDSPHVVRNPRNGRAYVIPRDLDIWKSDIRNLVEVDCVDPVSPAGREKYFRSPRLTGPLPPELRGRVYTKRDIWNIIVCNAWQTGEPGVVFIDRINEFNPTPHVGRIESTNPCGEQPLLPYEACNLGSINLGAFVVDECTPAARVDWDGLRETVHVCTRFLDNVIDANDYPLPEIERMCKANRKIGLGIMGFADALYKLGVPYNSAEGVAWGERFMQFVNDEAHACSEALARDRGCFPNWAGSIWQTRHNRMMRNACTTTVAPTGTISIIANCSGGIEPMFSLAFLRNVLKGQKQGERPLIEVNETFRRVAQRRGFYSDALIERVAREGTLAHVEEVPDDVRRVFVCAHDITPEWHMNMQAAFQRHCDSSISKTINFPESATVEDVEKIYRLAYALRCKGVTVYRDGCRTGQPMALKEKDAESRSDKATAHDALAAPRPPGDAASDAPCAPCTSGRPVPTAATVSPDGNGHSGNGNGQPADAADVASVADRPAPARVDARAGAAARPPVDPSERQADGSAVRATERDPIDAAPPTPRLAAATTYGIEAPATGGTVRVTTACLAPRPSLEPQDLPEIVSGLRVRQLTPFGNMHVNITVDARSERELEVFAQLGKGGDVATSDLEAICRIVSLWLRAGGSLNHVIKQLEGIGSSLQIPTRAGRIMSLGDGLATALKKYRRAKERFGLRALLTGEIDPAEIDNPNPPPHTPARMPRDNALPRKLDRREEPVRGLRERDGSLGGSDGAARDFDSGNGGAARSPDSGNGGAARNPESGNGGATRNPESGNGGATRARGALAGSSGSVLHEPAHAGAVVREPGSDAPVAVAAPPSTPRGAVAPSRSPGAASQPSGPAPTAASLPAAGFTFVAAAAARVSATAPRAASPGASSHYKLKCPECGGALAAQEGCAKCHGCGWAQC